MAFRVATFWVLQADRLGGWSENFWLDTTDRGAAVNAAEDLVQKSKFAKASQPYCPRFRITDPAVFRSGKTTKRFGAGPPPEDQASYPADYITTKWQIRVNSQRGSTTQWIGGLPDDYVIKGSYNRDAITNPSWTTFIGYLLTSTAPWSVRVLDSTVPVKVIQEINNTTGIVTAKNHQLGENDRIRIKGVRGLTQANGLWNPILIPNNPDQFQLPTWQPTTQVMTKSNASFRVQKYVYSRILSIEVIQATSHKAGRPTGLLGGSRKKRKTA